MSAKCDCKVIPFKVRHREAVELRAAKAFHGPRASFEWLNENWAATNLRWIRLAAGVLGKRDEELDRAIGKLFFFEEEDGSLAIVFKRWREAKRDLDEMRAMLEAALNRSLESLERINSNPDDSPPNRA